MKKSELIRHLNSFDEEEVFIEIDGIQYEIEIKPVEEVFDGFEIFYEASLSLIPNKNEKGI